MTDPTRQDPNKNGLLWTCGRCGEALSGCSCTPIGGDPARPSDEQPLDRIADALEKLAEPPATFRLMEEGELTEAEHRAWLRESVEQDRAVQKRQADALERIANALDAEGGAGGSFLLRMLDTIAGRGQ